MNTDASSVQSVNVSPAQVEADALLAHCDAIAAIAEKVGPDAFLHLCASLGRSARFSKAARPEFGKWVATVAALTFGKVSANQAIAGARHANNQADGEVFVLKAGTSGGNTSVAAKLKTPSVVSLRMD